MIKSNRSKSIKFLSMPQDLFRFFFNLLECFLPIFPLLEGGKKKPSNLFYSVRIEEVKGSAMKTCYLQILQIGKLEKK